MKPTGLVLVAHANANGFNAQVMPVKTFIERINDPGWYGEPVEWGTEWYDPEYWPEGKGCVLPFDPIVPRVETQVTRWVLP